VALIRSHRVVHTFACSLAIVLVAALVKGQVESDSSQPLNAAIRLTRGSPQRLELSDVVAHLGDDGVPVIAPIGDVVDVPALVGTVTSPDGGAPALIPEAPAIAVPVAESVDLPPVAYSLLAAPGLQSRGRAPPSA
jgi:hypothetical protein